MSQEAPRLRPSALACAMSRAADAAEGKTLGHARCVAHLAWLLADDLHWDDAAKGALLVAGLLHDVGWMLVAPDVARAAGPGLDNPLRSHPVGSFPVGPEFGPLLAAHHQRLGERLEALDVPADSLRAIEAMHAVFDGSDGGPRTDAIDLGARLLAVADHAITLAEGDLDEHEYPRRARERLRQMSGGRLDPEVTRVALGIVAEPSGWELVRDEARATRLAADVIDAGERDEEELESPRLWQWAEQMGMLADRYHPMVADHAAGVRSLAGRIAAELGIGPRARREIELAAGLAELGRVGLPAAIVFRMGAFTEEERQTLRSYPTIGERILRPIRSVPGVFRAAITHREKLNGTGYPEGLMGNEIPLGGRIIAVADTYLALTSANPQRPGFAREKALRILNEEATKLFDGLAVDALEAVLGSDEHPAV